MAAAVVNPNPAPTNINREVPPARVDNGAPAGERPKWLPEKFKSPEDFAAAYGESEKKITELGQRASVVDRLRKEWGDDFDFSHLTKAEVRQLAAKQAEELAGTKAQELAEAKVKEILAQRTQGPNGETWDPFDGEKVLSAAEARVLAKAMPELKGMIEQYWKQGQGQIANGQQQFSLLARALDAKLKNPDLDTAQVWERLQKLATMNPEGLMDLATSQVLAPSELKGEIDKAVAAAKATWEQEIANKNTQVLQNSSIFKPKGNQQDRPKNADERKQSVLLKALHDGSITASQI